MPLTVSDAALDWVRAHVKSHFDTDAESMLESLHVPIADVESAWAEEIERRFEAFDRGKLPSYPAEEVFAEARRLRCNAPASLRLPGKHARRPEYWRQPVPR
jgi:hypothetical protein